MPKLDNRPNTSAKLPYGFIGHAQTWSGSWRFKSKEAREKSISAFLKNNPGARVERMSDAVTAAQSTVR